MGAYRFFGYPFSAAQWNLLVQLLDQHRQIDISITVDLPPLGGYGYDEKVEGMREEIELNLLQDFGPGLTVKLTGGRGGTMARIVFRITRP